MKMKIMKIGNRRNGVVAAARSSIAAQARLRAAKYQRKANINNEKRNNVISWRNGGESYQLKAKAAANRS